MPASEANPVNKMSTPKRQIRHASGADDRSVMARTTPRQRPQGLTPRSYQAKVDLCRLWDLMNQGRSQAEIARMMRKDPAWVSRSIQTIQSDFSTVFQRPAEKAITDDHLARIESLFSKAMRIAEDGEGMAQAAAVRTAASLLRDRMQFLQFVGLTERNQENPPINQMMRFGGWDD